VGLPTLPAVKQLLRAYGCRLERRFDWSQLIEAHPEIDVELVSDYGAGERVTIRAERLAG